MSNESNKQKTPRYIYAVNIYENGVHVIEPIEVAEGVPSCTYEKACEDIIELGKTIHETEITQQALMLAISEMSKEPDKYGFENFYKGDAAPDTTGGENDARA